MSVSLVARLENYTIKHPQEVLIVHAQVAGEADEILIFRGFSSSLMRPTAFDLEVPVLPPNAEIQRIDRLQGPYQPQSPQYLERGLSLPDFIDRLNAAGL
jgi:hypothetical protein